MFAILFISSCGGDEELTPFVTEEEITIGAYLEENKETYSKFYEVASKAGIIEPLKLYNPNGSDFTLFLPENSAFDKYISESAYSTFEELIEDQAMLDSLARFHIVSSGFKSSDFPYGTLGDTTITGEYLYIGFDQDFNYKVNNSVDIVQLDIELYNGFIHIVDGILEPNNLNSFEYLLEREEYSIITELFELTGLADTMDVFRTSEKGKRIRNYYTLMVETNEVLARYGISNIDSLISLHATPGLEYTDPENGIYQYAAYHLLEGRYAINDFSEKGPYVTYAFSPITIDANEDIIINEGLPVYDTIVIAGDSIPLNYIRLDLYQSNGFSLNGPIHTLNDPLQIMEPTGTYEFQFYNEPVIEENKKDGNISPMELSDPSDLVYLSWSGIESIFYLAGINGPKDKDCLYAFANFSLEYRTPNVAAGNYEIWLRIDKQHDAPQIKVFIDGIQQNSIVDLSLGQTGFRAINIGNRKFESFGPHTIRIETVVGGEFYWDWIQFRPV